MDTSVISEDHAKVIRKAFAVIRNLDEEKKSISEDIREEKIEVAKKVEMSVKDVNSVFKVMHDRENGTFSEDNINIAIAVQGDSSLPTDN